MNAKCAFLAGLLAVHVCGTAVSQIPNLLSGEQAPRDERREGRIFNVQYPPPYAPPYYGDYGATTAFGSAAQGMSQVIGAAGSYNLQTAQASVEGEKAESIDIDNRKKATQTYFEMRQINQAYQESQRKPRLTQEQYARMAAMGAPKRLTSGQLDPTTGKIGWPGLLRDSEYDPYRTELDTLFRERATSEGVGSSLVRSIREYCNKMLQQLRTHSNDPPEVISSREYMNSKYFIDSLAYEAQQGAY